MAFGVDARPGVRETDSALGIVVRVGQLDRHDALFRYKRNTVKVRQDSSI